ncbi:MAG: O-antigen ligase family protein [Actinobacteria bacterium]|nr:O-antigen ligase family protein [Actinomycetota bacterium]
MNSTFEARVDRGIHWIWIPVIIAVCLAVGLLLSQFSPGFAVFVSLAVAATIAFITWPRLALYGLLLLSPFYFILNDLLTSGQLAGLATHISILDYLVIIAVAGTVWQLLRGNQYGAYRLAGIDIMALLWLAVVFVGLAYGYSQGFEASFRSARGPLMYALYFVAAFELTSNRRLREFGWIMMINSYAIGVIGLLAVAGYLTPYFPELTVGLVGDSLTLTRPNFFVEPALTIPNIIFLVLHFRFMGLRVRRSLFLNVLIAGALVLNMLVLALSVTRGFWLGMIAALLAAALLLSRYFNILKFRQILKVCVFSVFTAIAVSFILERFFDVSMSSVIFSRLDSMTSGSDPTSDYRLNEFQVYLRSFLESPLIGHGFGSSLGISIEYASYGFAHNQYIWILQTTGLFGGIIFAIFILLAILNALKTLSASREDGLPEMMNVLFLSTLAGFAAVSFTSPELSNPTTVPLMVTLLGISRAQFGRLQSRSDQEVDGP